MDATTDRRIAHLKRTRAVLVFLLTAFGVLALRLWQLQVLGGLEFRQLAENNRVRIEKETAPRGIIYDRFGRPLVKNVPAFDISVVPEEFPGDRTELLASLLSLQTEELEAILKTKRRTRGEPLKVKIDASLDEVALVEARRLELPGVRVDVEISRGYLYDDMASHVLGYLGRLRPDQQNSDEYKHVPANAYIGQWGLEARYDESLRGKPGDRVYEVNALGQRIRQIGYVPPEKGQDIYLTLDLDVQLAAEKALREETGAAVALDPNTGEVLAFVSRPSFDPNLFSTGISSDQWNRLLEDPRKPLFNRALQAQFPPGSTFKIVVALAGLEQGYVDGSDVVTCKGWISFGSRIFRCWKREGHGLVDFRRALVESCDVYFYSLGLKLGIDTIARYARALGLGTRPGLGLVPEAAGIVPSSQWKRSRFKEPWYPGETLNAAIGQGYVSVSPFQAAQMTATLVNGGKLHQPRLIMGFPVGTLGITEFRPDILEKVRDALLGVVEDLHGTARVARSELVSIGGKTGTAQVTSLSEWKEIEGEDKGRLEDHAWFVAFAPAENPQIALSVFVEHGGHGGSAASPIAKVMIEAFTKERNLAPPGPGGAHDG